MALSCAVSLASIRLKMTCWFFLIVASESRTALSALSIAFLSLGWDLDRLIRNYLKQELLFTDQEIRNNIDLFRDAQKKLDLMLELSTLKGKSRDKKNPKGYIINALKGKVKDKEEL